MSPTQRLFSLATIAFLAFFAGCGPSEEELQKQRDVETMQAFGEKFRNKVEDSLETSDLGWVRNMAFVSCYFAREIDYVAGNPPQEEPEDNKDDASDESPQMGLVPTDVVYDRIRKTVLRSDITVDGMGLEFYDAMIVQVLSEDDMQTLKEVRERHGYWDTFKETVNK
jgi:hypothetical protein